MRYLSWALAPMLLAAGPALAAPEVAAKPAISASDAGVLLTPVPAKRQLVAEARMQLTLHAAGLSSARLRLSPGLRVRRVDLNWRPARFTRKGDVLEVKLPPKTREGQRLALTVAYAGRPLRLTGRQRQQDLGPEGLLLHPDGQWMPQPEAGLEAVTVRLNVPYHWRALSPTTKQAFDPFNQTYRFEFGAGVPRAIAAGHLKVFPLGSLKTYLRPFPDPGLVPAYASAWGRATRELASAGALLDLYRAHGIGTPEATGSLIELPADFAPLSLPGWLARPHQDAFLSRWVGETQWALPAGASPLERQWLQHSLAAYSVDLLAEKQHGPAAYKQATQAHQHQYEAFLDGEAAPEAALSQAIAPASDTWQAVVIHKGAMLWGQLRGSLGDEAFWELLRGYQARTTHGHGGWDAFKELGGRSTTFLQSWLTQPGLPAFQLRDVEVREADGRYQVTGRLVSSGPAVRMPLELRLIANDETQHLRFHTFADETPFHFITTSKPLRLMVDPDEQLPLRRRTHMLIPEGVAPSDGLIVYGTQGDDAETSANREAALAMQQRLARYRHVALPLKADTEVTDDDRRHSLLLFGRPSTNALADEWADQFPVRFADDKALWWQGRTYAEPSFGTVQIIANPQAPEQTVVLFAALQAKGLTAALDYTQQRATFCIFEGDRLLEAGRALCTFPDQEAVLY